MTDTVEPAEGAAAEAATPVDHAFEFEGHWRELLPIALVNLGLSIVTLGLYRFWARTRVRQYVWSKVRFLGDSFEYTGRGVELFVGFLIVLVTVFLPLGWLVFEAQIMMQTPGQESRGIGMIMLAYLVMFYLMGVALYRRNRYRLSRTRWRGIRGNQREEGFAYGGLYFMLLIANMVTWGLAAPVVANRLWEYETQRREFGTGAFSYSGRAKPLYRPFFLALLMGIPLFIVMMGVFGTIVFGIVDGGSLQIDESGQPDPSSFWKIFGIGMLFYLFFGLAIAGPVMWYHVKKLQHFWRHSAFEGCSLRFDGNFKGIVRVWLGNLAIMIFTLGLGAPFMEMRWVRYLVANMRMEGHPDLARIAQAAGTEPSLGEGLAEGFDFGGI